MRRPLLFVSCLSLFACSEDLTLDASIVIDAGVLDAAPAPPTPPDAGLPQTETAFRSDPTRDLPIEVAIGPCMDAHLADLDDDGDLDVVLAFEGPSNRILENDGTGRFLDRTPSALLARTEDSEDVVAFDADGDGRLDLLFVSEDLGGENELYLAVGDFDFVEAPLPGAGVTNGLAIGDVNGDGIMDAVLGNNGPDFLWFGVGDGSFAVASTTAFPTTNGATQDVEFGDIDGDGDLDLVVAREVEDQLFVNDGRGNFTDVSERLLTRGPARIGREADFGDVDGDGDLDLFVANVDFSPTANPRDRLLVNDGNGTFSPVDDTVLPPEDLATLDGDFADLDHDGDLDLVTANARVTNQLLPAPYRVWENVGARFVEATARWFPERYEGFGIDVEVGDLDGDGALDVYLCGRSSTDRVLFGAR